MTTNKNFSFNIQMFATGYTLTISGASALNIASGSFVDTTKSGADTTATNVIGLSATGGDSGASSINFSTAKWFSVAGGDSVLMTAGGNSLGVIATDTSKAFYLKLQGVDNAINWSGLQGSVSVNLQTTTAFSSTINNSAISIASNTGGVLNLSSTNGSDFSASIAGGSVAFTKVNQDWVVKANAAVGLGADGLTNYVTATKNNATLNKATSDKYLDFTLGAVSSKLTFAGEHSSLAVDGINFGSLSAGTFAKIAADKYVLTATTADSSIVAAGATFGLSANASATISGTGANASVVAISDLGNSGVWQVGDATNVTLGTQNWVFGAAKATLTAASNSGIYAAEVDLASGAATLNNASGIVQDLDFNNKVNWKFAAATTGSASATQVVFDNSGNITGVKGAAAITFAAPQANNATVASIATGSVDSLTLGAAGASIAINADGHITDVHGALAKNSTWTAGVSSINFDGNSDGTAEFKVNFASKSADSVYGVLTADSVDGTAIASVASLAGNATITANSFSAALADTPFTLGVMGKNWTIAKDADGQVAFDTLGNASVNGASFYVAGDAGAIVSVGGANTTALNGATVNGAQVSISGANNSSLAFGLEAAETGAGIASITGLGHSANVTVSGDNTFAVAAKNANYEVTTSGTNESLTAFTVVDDTKANAKLVFDVESGASYNVTGGNALFNLLIPSSDVDNSTATTSTTVTINGTVVDLNPTSGETVNIATDGEGISAVTMSAGDAITTGGDKEFAVVVKAGTTSDTDTTVITVNDTKISIASSLFSAINADTTLNVDQTGDTAKVTINGGLASSADYTVTSGVYKVGQNAADTITESSGYITVASGGAATVENASNKALNESFASAISSLASDASLGASIGAYQAFYDLSKVPTSISGSDTVTNWENDDDTLPTAGAGNTGYNLYADTLTSAAKSVTLQANGSTTATAAPIVVAKNESSSIANAVIDLSNSAATHSVIIGAGDSVVSANHTVIGAGKGDTIVFGDKATGSNVAKAGDGDSYLVNTTASGKSKKSSLLGGAGNDTIIAGAGDYVEGGSGVDFFKDSAAYQVNDYSVEDGDIIIANKLSTLGVTDPISQLSLSGNVIQVNGGAKVTLGSSYDENNSMAAVIAGADGSTANAKYVAWASDYGSTVDTSARESAAIIVGSHNSGAGDLLTGGSKADTIYAGGNDSVISGAGADYIVLEKASLDNGELGAMVALSAGKNSVVGWTEGFDNEAGANILYRDGGADGISLKSSNDVITAYGSDGSITFADTSTDASFSFLVGVPTDDDEDNGLDKVTFIKKNEIANVTADSLVADLYYGEKKNGINFTSGVEKELEINLGGDNYQNITAVTVGSANTATIFSTAGSVKETVNVAGDTLSAETGAHKIVSLGGGNDLMISGGSSTLTAGNTFYFSAGDGKDTIQSFGFYNAADTDLEAADLIYINNSLAEWVVNGGGVKGTGSKVEISTTSSDKVILSGAGTNDIIRVQFNDSDTVYNVKVGNTSSTSNFAYDTGAQLYYGNATKGKDTLTVAGEQDVGVWLTSSLANSGYRDSNNNTYIGVGAIDATAVTNSSATLVGADSANNTLTGAGSGSTTSLWGGMGGSNALIGGAGEDTFVFFKGYGNNDTITSCSTSDKVWLPNVSVNDLDFTKMTASNSYGISTNKIELYLNDGSKLTVASPATTTNFTLSDGEYVANARTKSWSVA